jgi:hypothetical protein
MEIVTSNYYSMNEILVVAYYGLEFRGSVFGIAHCYLTWHWITQSGNYR